ncbi:MAG TPA: DHA2 family efflux MFS transporter permease subunit [Bryobacteraceae bacterium]|jgi:DHA2 family multidrug resistance protein|nr:DHA2 family efflux MFS transporter permease subunit [Bryobacteraceae bacterium]
MPNEAPAKLVDFQVHDVSWHRGVSPWVIAMTVMLATFMEVLDTSVANVALPHVAGSLSASTDESTWMLTSYLVANAIILPMGGWFSMLLGRKRFYMICVALFTVSSFLCGMAPTLGTLIFFRVLQGIGGGALQPVSQAILVESFPREKQGMAMAFYGMGVVVAPVIGPTLGGWITDNYTWRWIFLINIPVGILSLLLTTMLIFDPPYLKRKSLGNGFKIDYAGFGLLALGLGALEVVLDEGQKEDWFSSHFIVTFAVITVLCLVGVVIWELRQKEPIIDFRILKDRNYTLATASMLVLGFVLYASTALMPLFLQNLLGYTAMMSGLVLSPGGLVMVVCMPVVGILVRKYQPRWLIIFGIAVASLGLFMMSRFTLQVDYGTAAVSRMVQSAGLAFLFVPISATAFAFIPRDRTSYATGLFNLARNIGGSSGIATATTMLARRAQFHQQVLVAHLTPYDSRYREAVAGAAAMLRSAGSSAPDANLQAQGIIYGTMVRQSNMLAFADAFWVMGVLFLLVIPMMFFLKRVRPGAGQVVME